jgi:RIO-like serine/threonine protein kinase
MASELYQSFGTSANNAQVQQNPREQAMALMKQQGINVPENIANNPNAIIQHLVQSGAVPQQRLNMAQQIMQRMFRR